MFPNPTTGEVTLRVDGFHAGVTMQVMDGAGRVVWWNKTLPSKGTRCSICLVYERRQRTT